MGNLLHRDNIALMGIGFLVFIVLSSKQLILYNEEILVAISFLLFIIFSVFSYGHTVADSFDDRSNLLKSELIKFLQVRENSLNELIDQKTKLLDQNKIIQKIGIDSFLMLSLVVNKRSQTISAVFYNQTLQKFKNLWLCKRSFQQELQQVILKGFRRAVLENCQKSKATIKPVFLAQAFDQLSKN